MKRNKKKKLRVKDLSSIEKEIMGFFYKMGGKQYSTRQIHRAFMANNKKRKLYINNALSKLAHEGKLSMVGKKYILTSGINTVEGIVDYVNPNFAFIMVEQMEHDIKVSSRNMRNALHGDKVTVRVYNSDSYKPEGEVLGIVEKSKRTFIGNIEISNRFAFVVPNDRKMHNDIFINTSSVKNAKHGDRVIAEIKEWREGDKNPIGIVKQVLGKAGDNDAEIHTIMFEYDLPFEFPKHIEDAANKIPDRITKEEIAKRKDFRKTTTFTIDPLTAKDFDDALSIKKLKDGQWEIGIHIADVTHYVKPNTQLEDETFKRATSVYLVDRTVPMLPEKLSNGLCSLRPHEEKYTFSAVFNLDEKGNILKEWFGRTVIYSDRRFTYEEAQQVIESGEGDFVEELRTLNDIAKNLKGKRFDNGAISFESVEFYFELDEKGRPTKLIPKERKDAHKLVEEFMLLANKRVANFIFNKKENAVSKTMVYRTHDDPDPEKVSVLAQFVQRFGHKIQTEPRALAHSLNKLAQEVEGKPEQNIIETQAIRTMSKAKYSVEPNGHYGLAFDHYTHFTSPIRRYPDMMVHRLLQHYLDNGKSADEEDFAKKCLHSSEKEKRAAEAERASIKYKQVEFMSNYLMEEMQGMITGITEWGIYVEIEETKCEGMVRLATMEDDYYYYDEEKQQVIGKRHGFVYQFGDKVMVRVLRTDLIKRTIDLEML